MEDMKKILRMWYALFESEDSTDVKQSIIFDYINNYPIEMFNAAVWLYSMNASPKDLKAWICAPSFDNNIKGANLDMKRMKPEDREKLRTEFIISVNEAYVLTFGIVPDEYNGKSGMLLC